MKRLAVVLLLTTLCSIGVLADDTPVVPIHNYYPAGNLNDSMGGPSLVSLGGVSSNGTYVFGPGQGLSLTGALPNGSYSIEMVFTLNQVTGGADDWFKLIDFSNLVSDKGLYVAGGSIYFWNSGGSNTQDVAAGARTDLVMTKDAASNVVAVYINNVLVLLTVDTDGATNGSVLTFFKDDNYTDGIEQTGGTVSRITLYDHALNQGEVNYVDDLNCIERQCGASVPEPSSLLLLSAGLSAMVGLVRRRRRL